MKKVIKAFIEDHLIAIAGVSHNSDKWGNSLMRELMKLGYTVYPINPTLGEVEGVRCYASVRDLPSEVHGIIFSTKPDITTLISKEIPGSEIKRVWMHRGAGKGAYSEDAFSLLKEHNIGIVYDLCPMMFFNGKGIHRFHYKLRKLFGGVPEGVC